MIRNNKKALLVLLVMLPCMFAAAQDFGFILDITPGYGGYEGDEAVDFTGMAIPRFSTLLGDNGNLFIAGALKADYFDDKWTFIPELLRTDVSFLFDGMELTLGRMQYSDPLGYIAEGLFDGAEFSLDAFGGTFSLGAWYTGFLYKKRANIAMTSEELDYFYSETEYSDFLNTYFAPARVLASFGWEHPALAERLRAEFAVLGQYDLSGGESVHSQYFAGSVAVPAGNLLFDFGGCAGLLETAADMEFLFAGDLGVSWFLPSKLEDSLSFLGRFSSGVIEGSTVGAFLPVTTSAQGEILKAKLSGLSVLTLDYTARPHPAFSFIVSSSYFIRSDLGTYQVLGGTDGYFLGNEFFGKIAWSPASDFQFQLSGGIFLPSLGDVAPSGKNLWRVELNSIISLY